MNLTEIKTALVSKAKSDSDFRRQLLANPRVAAGSTANKTLPSDVEVRVFEESPTSFCLVLPPVPANDLSDSDLASVPAESGQGLSDKELQRRERDNNNKFWMD